MSSIKERLQSLRSDIIEACLAAGRDPADVHLLAVSKTKPAGDVMQAWHAGQRDFGENQMQEAISKVNALPDAEWHFVGAIQSNKTRDIATRFNWVHSVASAKVARRLSEQRPEGMAPLKTLIQVNISGEASKSGVSPEAAQLLAADMAGLPGLTLEGLMAIPAATDDEQAQRAPFRELRELKENIEDSLGINMPHLSMGMTGDFTAAILEGSTWIRIGTAIFGSRTR